jgi:hypothetical protein
VTSVAKLPADVRAALIFQLEVKQLEMADAGMPFSGDGKNAGRAVPDRRLIAAAIGARYSIVHFEGFVAWLHAPIVKTYRDPQAFEQAIRSGEIWKPQR